MLDNAALDAGREALRRGAWSEARTVFADALKRKVTPEVLEDLGWTCWWLSDVTCVFDVRARAYRAYRRAGNLRGAARLALWIASDHVDFRGQVAIAHGWRRRARRLLEGFEGSEEHGWLQVHEGAVAIELEHRTREAKRCGAEAAACGRRLGVIDLEAMGMALQGLALVSEGEIAAGTSFLDEAMAAATGDELREPWTTGWVTCYLIYACERMRDFGRAAEWCQRMDELARRFRFRFWSGICRAHYAGVLTWQGRWEEAEAELADAICDLEFSRPPYAAEGVVRLAELRRRQGRFDDAAVLFERAAGHPLALVGGAELALDRGEAKEAEDLLQRFLRQTPAACATLRAPAFELLVRAYVALHDHGRAAVALERLRSVATAARTPPLLAAAAYAEGILDVAAGEHLSAGYRLADALDLFQQSGATLEAGRTRLELAKALFAQGRTDAARKEARAALRELQTIGARHEAERAARVLEQWTQTPPHARPDAAPPLTRRELEILGLVAQGLSDKRIAAQLGISGHTVHRHVSNILTKLALPSRAAAVAFAAKADLI